MMKYIFGLLIILSAVASLITGNGLTEAILNEPVRAVELCFYLCGGMCFWGGLMRIAESSGLTKKISSVLGKALGMLFPGLDKNGRAFRAICMNVTANLLGLGNAATPAGIEAVKEMAKEERAGDTATPSMIIFTVLNTASLTLIPSTAISLRIKYGSTAPAEIIPAIWITSAVSLTAALTAAILMNRGKKK